MWPILVLFDSKRACDIAIMEPLWATGYVISIWYCLYYAYRKICSLDYIKGEKFLFFFITFISYLIWSKYQLGYSRYGLVVLVLGGIATYTFIYDIFKSKKIIFISLILPVMLFNYFYTGYNYMFKQQDWIYNNYYNNVGDYKYNLKNLFARGDEEKIEFEEGSVWAIFYCNAGLAQMINDEIPIINVTSSADNDYTSKLLNKKLNNASHIYTLVDSLDLANFISNINQTDFRIVDVKKVLTSKIIGNESQFVYVFEIDELGSDDNNYDIFQDKEYDVQDKNQISMFIGIAKDLNKAYSKDLSLNVIGIKDDEEYVIDSILIPCDGNMKYIKYDVSEYEKIILKSFDEKGEIDLNNWFMNFNLRIN